MGKTESQGKTDSYSDGRGHAQYIFTLIFCWWAVLCSLPVIYLGPNYGGDDEDNGDLLQNIPCMLSVPPPSSRLPLTHASTRVSWTLTAKSGSVSCESLLLSPGSWCTQGSVCALQEPAFPVLCKFWRLCGGLNGYLLQEDLCHAQGLLHPEPLPL